METEIKRINFFDGLFLRQEDFIAEQLYHQHMRRRLNYILFDGSGVVQVEPGDLLVTPTPGGAKSLRVTAGMAISRRDDLREGREIILRGDSPTIDLSANGFVAGDQAFVAIHLVETRIEPQTLASPNTPTRVEESAIVTLHKSWPTTAAPPPGGESYILLGRVDFNTMAVNSTQRQTAKLRASLLGAAPSTPKTLLSIAITPASPPISVGLTQQFIATGTYDIGPTKILSAADGLVWSSSIPGFLSISPTGLATAGVTPGSVTITATVGTITNTTTATITPVVVTPVPTLLTGIPNTNGRQMEPLLGPTGSPFSIFGRNLGSGAAALPTVELLSTATSAVIHTFVVAGITQRTEPGFVNFDVIAARVGPFAGAAISGKVRVTTSGGSVTSTDNFTIL